MRRLAGGSPGSGAREANRGEPGAALSSVGDRQTDGLMDGRTELGRGGTREPLAVSGREREPQRDEQLKRPLCSRAE